MCELKVMLNGKKVFGECIYAKQENDQVIVKDVLGFKRGFLNTTIAEVNIGKKTLTLKSSK